MLTKFCSTCGDTMLRPDDHGADDLLAIEICDDEV